MGPTMYDRVEECRTRLRSELGLSCDASASGGVLVVEKSVRARCGCRRSRH